MPVRKYNPDDNIEVWKPKNFNWIIEKPITKEDLHYKKTLGMLMDEIDAALQIGDKKWFNDLCKEYNALKIETL